MHISKCLHPMLRLRPITLSQRWLLFRFLSQQATAPHLVVIPDLKISYRTGLLHGFSPRCAISCHQAPLSLLSFTDWSYSLHVFSIGVGGVAHVILLPALLPGICLPCWSIQSASLLCLTETTGLYFTMCH